jgi:hypothetical protein
MKNTFIRHNPDQSWLHGKFPAINAEINTKLPYVSFNNFFAQGTDAEIIINEIHNIWINSDLDIEQSIQKWINAYL